MDRSDQIGLRAAVDLRPAPAPHARRERRSRNGGRRRFAGQLTLALALTLRAAPAQADEIDDLVTAHGAFINGDYALADGLLRTLSALDASNPRLAPIVTAARKYLAASLFAQRREGDAQQALEDMLRSDPDVRLDPQQFDQRFLTFFEAVVLGMRSELDQIRRQRVLTREQAETQRLMRQELARRLITTETQATRVPFALMWIPFGVGQFANGQTGLGVLFLTSELLLTAACVTTFALYQTSYYPPNGVYYVDEFPDAVVSNALRVTNLVSAGVLAATMGVGVVQAIVAWQPVRGRTTVPRPMPRELEGFRLMAAPLPLRNGAGLTVGLTF